MTTETRIRPALAAAVAACIAAASVFGVGRVEAQGSAPAADYVPGELIVRLTPGAGVDAVGSVAAALGGASVKRFRTVEGLHVIKLPPTLSVQDARRLARTLGRVAYAEPNYIVHTQTTPNDPSFTSQWALHNTGQTGGTAGADIHATEAWDITTGSSSVVVALLDTGIDYTHPDLTANMFRNTADCNSNGIDDDGNGFVDDCYGIDTVNHDSDPMDDHLHGTHTAGIVGASGNNGVGVAGVNWNVRLMACKFLDSTGSGSTADAISCLDYVALMKDRGVPIVATNNSWSGGGFSQALYDAIDAQRQRGILFIAAAGNASTDNDRIATYPANYDLPNVIAVASTTDTDALSAFSNYGAHTVGIAAPGSNILSTSRGNTYLNLSGTSMAAPHVAGVAALLAAQDPTRDWRAIRNLILAGGDARPALAGTSLTGRRLNAFGSLTCSTATVFSRLRPITTVTTTTVGTAVTLSAINIKCASGNGNVTVTVGPENQVITLTDDGSAPDQVAGDGIYSAAYAPATVGTHTLTWPDGTTTTVLAMRAVPYTVQTTTESYRQITGTNLNLGDDTSALITLPFDIQFGGLTFSTLYVSSNGMVNAANRNDAFLNQSLPTTQASNLIAPFWDDLVPQIGTSANVFWAVTGSAPSRELVIEWRNVTGFGLLSPCASSEAVSFEVVFREGRSDILFLYGDVTFGGSCAFHDAGASATVGIQLSPAVATQYSFNAPNLSAGMALLWTPPPPGVFTDDPLTAGASTIKVLHIAELRSRIDQQRQRFGLPAFSWTDSTLIPGVAPIRAVHVIELRAALTQAFQHAGLPPPTFTTDPTITPGVTTVKGAHVQELRAAVVLLEGS